MFPELDIERNESRDDGILSSGKLIIIHELQKPLSTALKGQDTSPPVSEPT